MEVARPKIARDPGQPTEKEREEHNVLHMPYRSWCEDCVRGRKKNPAHLHEVYEPPEGPEVGADYGFMRDTGEEENITILVVRDREWRVTFSHQVPTKGAGWEY